MTAPFRSRARWTTALVAAGLLATSCAAPEPGEASGEGGDSGGMAGTTGAAGTTGTAGMSGASGGAGSTGGAASGDAGAGGATGGAGTGGTAGTTGRGGGDAGGATGGAGRGGGSGSAGSGGSGGKGGSTGGAVGRGGTGGAGATAVAGRGGTGGQGGTAGTGAAAGRGGVGGTSGTGGQAGTAGAGGAACPSGQTSCSGTCRNLTSDAANCGMCGHACGTGQTCSGSTCMGSSAGGNCPTSLSCPNGMQCGCYKVSGLGATKQALVSAGASQYMLASAMMETELMDATTYAYGDNKTGDSFNAGVAKQNWGMMRTCHPAWNGMGASAYATSAAMNTNRTLDVQVYNECRSYYGNNWWGGHRNGAAGLSNPNTSDILNFKAAMDWTDTMLTGHTTDDVRFWVDVMAIYPGDEDVALQ